MDVDIPMPSTATDAGGLTRSDYLITFDGGAASALGTEGLFGMGPQGGAASSACSLVWKVCTYQQRGRGLCSVGGSVMVGGLGG